MRLTLTIENKFVSIDIVDLPEEPADDDEVTTTEEETHIVLPVGFQLPPNTLDEDDDEEDDKEAPDTCGSARG